MISKYHILIYSTLYIYIYISFNKATDLLNNLNLESTFARSGFIMLDGHAVLCIASFRLSFFTLDDHGHQILVLALLLRPTLFNTTDKARPTCSLAL